MTSATTHESSLHLIVRRTIAASPERLFAAWTQPQQLMRWWGPEGVRCTEAHLDLRPGGAYRIANALPDGSTLWIKGTFETVEPPHRLVYSWRLEPGEDAGERVTVRFEPKRDATEVIVVHERIPTSPAREGHERGWVGCLEGLAAFTGAA